MLVIVMPFYTLPRLLGLYCKAKFSVNGFKIDAIKGNFDCQFWNTKTCGKRKQNWEMPLLLKRYDACNIENKQQYSVIQKVINVLGVLFDWKMTWAPQVEQTITKANKALNTIKLIRKIFQLWGTSTNNNKQLFLYLVFQNLIKT